jgi:tripartite-type tricarboxylate transporter receptor subunit TctC
VPALTDVVAGHIPVMFSDIPPLLGLVGKDKVRPLGVSTLQRVKAFPDVPPINEAGVPGFEVSGWFMLTAPAKTPKPIVDKLHAELKAIMAMPDVQAQIDKLSLLPMQTPPVVEMQAFVKSEIKRWGDIVTKAGIAGTQ